MQTSFVRRALVLLGAVLCVSAVTVSPLAVQARDSGRTTVAAVPDRHLAPASGIVPGECPGNFSSAIAFLSEAAGGPEVFCFGGHGESAEQISDVTNIQTGSLTGGWIVYDYGDGSGDNFYAFGANENIPFSPGIDVRSWGLD